MKLVIAIGFAVLAGLIVVSLIKSILGLFNFTWDKRGNNGLVILKIFKLPLLSFIAFLLYIFIMVPFLEKMI